MSQSYLRGSICLSDIPRELIKQAPNGKKYLNINIWLKREPLVRQFSDGTTKTYTHSVQCSCPKDKRVEGVNYYIGDLEEHTPNAESSLHSPDQIDAAPAADVLDMPF